MSTAGKLIVVVAVLPAVSPTVTLAVAGLASAASGVPLITPLPVLRINPDGSPVAPYSSMPTPPVGFMGVMATPTFKATGAV